MNLSKLKHSDHGHAPTGCVVPNVRQAANATDSRVAWERFDLFDRVKVTAIVLFFLLLTSHTRLNAQPAGGVQLVFACEFQRANDRNADGQPDGWTRKRDRQHPSYIEAQIQPRSSEKIDEARAVESLLNRLDRAWKSGRWDGQLISESTPAYIADIMDQTLLNDCYQVKMDGAAFELISSRFDMDTRYDYTLYVDLECMELKSHVATVELHVFDREGKEQTMIATQPISQTQKWQTLSVQQFSVPGPGTMQGELRLIIQPTSRSFGSGTVRFDNIRLYRMPTLTLRTDREINIVKPGSEVEITCQAAGLDSVKTEIELEVTDVDGKAIFKQRSWMQQDEPAVLVGKFSSRLKRISATPGKSSALFIVPFESEGLYQVHARIGSAAKSLHVAVLEHQSTEESPLGISISAIPEESQIDSFLSLVNQCQLGWVKMPIWYDSSQAELANRTFRLAKDLKSRGVRTVGRLDGPPKSQLVHFDEELSVTKASAFLQDPKLWEPLLEPVLTRINAFIDYIQLGSDKDTSLAMMSSSQEMAQRIRSVLQYYFQDPRLVVARDWLAAIDTQAHSDPTFLDWHAMQYSTETDLTADELRSYVPQDRKQKTQTWATIDPLPASTYSLRDRVIDLLERMVAIKETGVQAAFISNLYDAERGLINEKQQLNEILLPWVHIATAIGPRSSVGSIELPQGSRNYTFQGQQQDVMILFNETPCVEELYLGDKLTIRDIWGRHVAAPTVNNEHAAKAHQIHVGPWPVFVYGVDSQVIRWQQEFQLSVDHLTSHLSGLSSLPIQIHNTLSQRAKGSLTVISPSLIKGGSATRSIDLESGRTEKVDWPIELRSDASAGEHQLEFFFQVNAGSDYNFSVHRKIRLGHPDIEFRWELVRLNDQTVEARVELTNKTTAVLDFDCTLFPINRPYVRMELLKCGEGVTVASHQFVYPKTENSAARRTWIRCQQSKSPLTLNYMIQEKLE